jgi:hypothetical protein
MHRTGLRSQLVELLNLWVTQGQFVRYWSFGTSTNQVGVVLYGLSQLVERHDPGCVLVNAVRYLHSHLRLRKLLVRKLAVLSI